MTVAGNFQRCPTCGDWGWFGGTINNHSCKPRWECRGEWEDDSCWQDVHSYDAETAAEKYANRYDCEGGEYAIVSGQRHEWVVLVRKPKDHDPENDPPFERWAVEGESVPQYSATKIEGETP